MRREIMNGGIKANILKIAEENGANLNIEQISYMNKMLSLPKGVFIPIDENGNPITQNEHHRKFSEYIRGFTPIK